MRVDGFVIPIRLAILQLVAGEFRALPCDTDICSGELYTRTWIQAYLNYYRPPTRLGTPKMDLSTKQDACLRL